MFHVTISNKIKFVIIQEITDRNIPILNKAFLNTSRVYNKSGLKIQKIHVNPEVKPMEEISKDIDITINYATAQ